MENPDQKNTKEKIEQKPDQKNPKEKIVENLDQKNPKENQNQNINQSTDEKCINGKGVTPPPPPKETVSIGINIGAQNTIYSSFGKVEKNFISQVLLSDVSSRTIPSIIVYKDDHRLYGESVKQE